MCNCMASLNYFSATLITAPKLMALLCWNALQVMYQFDIPYTYLLIFCRVAAMHFNENFDRSQVTTKSGAKGIKIMSQ